MANTLGPLYDGNDYQARYFWLRACDLFEPHTHVTRVEFEASDSRAFDDVVVYFDDAMRDELGQLLAADHHQIKFHQLADGVITWDALMSPDFINASKVSFLQRLHDVQQRLAPSGLGHRFSLYSPWPVDSRDELAEVLSLQDERIRWRALASNRSVSRKKRREQLCQHLGLHSDAELESVLRPLRLQQGPALAALSIRLNERLVAVGLKPVDPGEHVHPYDDLIRKLYREEQCSFTRADIERVCKEAKLWRGSLPMEYGAIRVGLRSYERATERLDQETDEHLSLLPYFHGRFARSPEAWPMHIFPEVEQFLAQMKRDWRYHLHLDVHTSIAFAAGYCLDAKKGVDVVPVQVTTGGPRIWRPASQPDTGAYSQLKMTERAIKPDGADVAVAISLTKNIWADVEAYVRPALPEVGRIVDFALPTGSGPATVQDGTHAYLLACQISQFCKEQRTPAERRGRLHLFIAAPNGLVFFLGQQARGFGACLLYEYNFEQNLPGDYHHTLTFPPLRLISAQDDERIA